MEFIVKTLSTIMTEVIVDILKFLPSIIALFVENSVSEPLLRVLIHVMVGRGRPLAVQLRESGAGLSSWVEFNGFTVMEGVTREIGNVLKQ